MIKHTTCKTCRHRYKILDRIPCDNCDFPKYDNYEPDPDLMVSCRHEDCRFRVKRGSISDICDYISCMGHSRGTSIADCDKYQPRGKMIKKVCTICGREFTATSGRQQRCPACKLKMGGFASRRRKK